LKKLLIIGITAIFSIFAVACSSETNTTTNQSKENTNLKSATEVVKKAKEKSSTMKGDSYTEQYKLEHTFQSEAEDGMPINFTNIRIHKYEHDRIFKPYAERIIGQYQSSFKINIKGYKDDGGDTNTFEQEEYRVNGKIYYKTKEDKEWTVSPMGKVSPSFRLKFLDELIKVNNDKNIKMTQENSLYKLVFDKTYFNENKQLFDFYKKGWPFQHPTDFVESKLKKDSGQTILYDQAQFKNPVIEIWVDQNNFMIKKFSIVSSIRIPTVSTEKGKDGKTKVFPPFYIEEQWSAETKNEFTGSINLPAGVK
jgi:signal peptidase I